MTHAMTEKIRVIDTDTHVSEPANLWVDRLPGKWSDEMPRVEEHPGTGNRTWRVGTTWLTEEGFFAMAGWKSYPPDSPHNLDDEGVDPGSWKAAERIDWMDRNGIYAQILYPNVIAFNAAAFMRLEPELGLASVRAWNDYITEWANYAPERLLPIAMLPFWDVEATVEEMNRVAAAGHRGVLFSNQYDKIGLPPLWDKHWDRVYAAASDLQLPVNFHVGVGDIDPKDLWAQTDEGTDSRRGASRPAIPGYDPMEWCRLTVATMLGNASPIAAITTSGLCDRFPNVNFVSVESGFGYVPYLLESLDWHWRGHNGAERTGYLPPSEYFRRQCYGTFWFETATLGLLELYPDNFMFETDYPHPTSLSPGPASPAVAPSEHLATHLHGRVSETVEKKVLHETAAKLYGVK